MVETCSVGGADGTNQLFYKFCFFGKHLHSYLTAVCPILAICDCGILRACAHPQFFLTLLLWFFLTWMLLGFDSADPNGASLYPTRTDCILLAGTMFSPIISLLGCKIDGFDFNQLLVAYLGRPLSSLLNPSAWSM